MKKIFKVLLASIFMVCGASAFAAKKSIVCVTYPEYDWVMNILGNKASNFNVSLIQKNGSDLHSYQASVKDIASISKCDMLVYVGGESDEWVEKALKNVKNKKMIIVNMMEVLGDKVKEEEIVEGMEHEHDHEDEHHHDHEHEGHHHHDEEEELEYDEHIWLSLKNAIVITNALSENIQKLDPANAAIYKTNTATYVKQLSDLDKEYEKVVASASVKTLLFGDRFPFRYLTDDYGIKYYAAFVGCSAETEASFETIAFLAKKVDELGLKAVLTIEKSDKKIAKTIIANTKGKNQTVLEMDSLQSISESDIKSGRNYLSAMKNNLIVLKKALN